MEMKTLTVNGKTYIVADPDAAHFDNSKPGDGAWSGKNTVDRLCPAFSENGSVVSCHPVEGYPLSVVSQIQPVQEGEGDPSLDNIRPITGYSEIKLWRNDEQFSAQLGQTVYGGSFNWATGELVIDRKLITLDGTETWVTVATNTDGKKRYVMNRKSTDILKDVYFPKSATVIDSKLKCSILPTITTTLTYTCNNGIGSGNDILSVYIEQYATDPDGFKAAMTGAQILFGLETPITVQLTPQEILALSGENTLYSDTGDTTAKGRADPGALIQKLTDAVIALGGKV